MSEQGGGAPLESGAPGVVGGERRAARSVARRPRQRPPLTDRLTCSRARRAPVQEGAASRPSAQETSDSGALRTEGPRHGWRRLEVGAYQVQRPAQLPRASGWVSSRLRRAVAEGELGLRAGQRHGRQRGYRGDSRHEPERWWHEWRGDPSNSGELPTAAGVPRQPATGPDGQRLGAQPPVILRWPRGPSAGAKREQSPGAPPRARDHLPDREWRCRGARAPSTVMVATA